MKQIDYERIADSEEFKSLKKERNAFIFPITLFFVVATLLFPVLTGYTTILNKTAFWNISWAWIYALLLFVMVWTLVMIYMSKAKKLDVHAEQIVETYKKEGSV